MYDVICFFFYIRCVLSNGNNNLVDGNTKKERMLVELYFSQLKNMHRILYYIVNNENLKEIRGL